MKAFDLLIVDIGELVTADPAKTEKDNPLGRIPKAAVGVTGGVIAFAGPEADLPGGARETAKDLFEARGSVVFPGLIDSHTHPVFGGSREDEFARRLKGAPYMQIASEGGGINSTVRHTRAASEEELFIRAKHWLDEMLRWGVTCIEAKSGYGLETETELKQLRVIGRLGETQPMDVVPTFLGAHEFPPEYRDRRDAYVDLVIEEMLPAVIDQGIARFCDVFCEEGVFTIDQTSRILLAASELGLAIRFHAGEFADIGGALLAAEIGAVAADHLSAISGDSIAAMEQSDVIAALLPATSYYLGNGEYAPARRIIDGGVRVVLASDFNPGSAVGCNLPLVANMGCTQMKMTFEEAVLAITRHAADSLLIGDRAGRISPGMQADLLFLDIPRPEYFVYHFGRKHTWKVMKKGEWAYENPAEPVFLG